MLAQLSKIPTLLKHEKYILLANLSLLLSTYKFSGSSLMNKKFTNTWVSDKQLVWT